MKPQKSLIGLFAMAVALPVAANAQDGSVSNTAANHGLSYAPDEVNPPPTIPNPPRSWIDPDTGHRVIRLTDVPGSDSLYFNLNGFTPDGKKMVYTTLNTVGVVDLATFQTRTLVTAKDPQHRPRVLVVGSKTPTVFYTETTEGSDPNLTTIWAADMDTGEIRKLVDLPHRLTVASINADETLALGAFVENDADVAPETAGKLHADPGGMGELNLGEAMNKGLMMGQRLTARYPMTMFTVNLQTGQITPLLQHNTNWLNHFQFSPKDPSLLLFCHEGSWPLVDRIWTMHTDGTLPQLVHKRIMQNETDGHEWWGGDGKTIYYQLHYTNGMHSSFIASYNEDTGERTWLYYPLAMASIHDNSSADGKLFCGDGSYTQPWIFLLRPVVNKDQGTLGTNLIKAGTVQAEKLVNMGKTAIHHAQNYRLEPNPMFTPDQKYVVFRANFFGPDYPFAVEVAKASN